MKRVPVQPALVFLGDLSIQGIIKGLRTLVEPCQLAVENGAKRALIPIENRRQFLEVQVMSPNGWTQFFIPMPR